MEPELARHPDRLRWNSRYTSGYTPTFTAHPLAVRAMSMRLPAGPVLELASGPSGSALLLAAAGRPVTAVDASDVALRMLGDEATRRGLAGLITLVHADLTGWRPAPGCAAVVICTGFWDRAVFAAAVGAVASGGLIAWEALTSGSRTQRPSLPEAWCLGPGEPGTLLPDGFEIVDQHDVAGVAKRQLLARRRPAGSARD